MDVRSTAIPYNLIPEHQRNISIMKHLCFSIILCVVLLQVSGCQTIEGGYPEQGPIIGWAPFEHEEFRVQVDAANPREVTSLYGSKFASLRGLAVVIVMPDNKNPEGPLVLRRSSVSLELPSGKIIHPLDDEAMIKWGAEVGIKSAEDIYDDRWRDHDIYGVGRPYDSGRERADGVFRFYQHLPRGITLVFRFPQMIEPGFMPQVISGNYLIKYTIETHSGEKIPVQNEVPLTVKQ